MSHRFACLSSAAIAVAALVFSASASAENLAAFNARIAKSVEIATKEQTSVPPSDGPAVAKDKTVVIIPCAMGAEGCARTARGTEEAAALLGWKTVLIDGAGDLSKIANAIRRAVSIHADAIALIAVDANQVQGALKEAKAAGLKIVASDSDNKDNLFDAINPTQESSRQAGYNLAATAYLRNNGKLSALIMNDREFSIVQYWLGGVEAFVKECAAVGGDCKLLASDNFLVADLTTRLPGQAVALVRRNPNYNYLFAGYDAALNFMIKGLRSASLDKQGHGAGFDGNSANLDLIRNDGYQDASSANPMEWYGYAMIDQLNRLFNNAPVVESGAQSKVLVKANIPAEGSWVGDVDFRAYYRKAWKLP